MSIACNGVLWVSLKADKLSCALCFVIHIFLIFIENIVWLMQTGIHQIYQVKWLNKAMIIVYNTQFSVFLFLMLMYTSILKILHK